MSELKLEPIIADDVVWGKAYYEMQEVDDVIANLKAENDHLRSTTHSERDEYIDMVNAKDKEIAELKSKLEDAQASAYAESVDAGMRERRLRRALWIAHANKAKFKRWWLHLALDCEASAIRPDTKTINRIKGKIGNARYRILKYVPKRNIVSNDLITQNV